VLPLLTEQNEKASGEYDLQWRGTMMTSWVRKTGLWIAKLHALISQDGQRSETKLDTPTLIEVWRTAPYLHDGRYLTVHELLSEGRHGFSHLSQDLNEDDINALTNFVLSL
jgi:cytochrome c peroxidase